MKLGDRGSAQWDAEALPLVDWLGSAVDRLPRSPFWLWPQSHRVSDPGRFFRSLAADVAGGPSGPRARNGALQEDLRRLRDLFSRRRPVHLKKPLGTGVPSV
jgi:hypothetical protein